jgi:cvfA/B/C family virulence factor
MATVQVLYWQDVPSVVKAIGDDGTEVKRQLADWFQQEIDNRAMTQGLVGSDAYLEQWRWSEAEERPGSPADALDEVARELEARFG